MHTIAYTYLWLWGCFYFSSVLPRRFDPLCHSIVVWVIQYSRHSRLSLYFQSACLPKETQSPLIRFSHLGFLTRPDYLAFSLDFISDNLCPSTKFAVYFCPDQLYYTAWWPLSHVVRGGCSKIPQQPFLLYFKASGWIVVPNLISWNQVI